MMSLSGTFKTLPPFPLQQKCYCFSALLISDALLV
jgi:hypothetical protein